MRLVVLPGVFHPGFFSSTRFLLEHISTFDLNGKKTLELGAGTGIFSVYCALKGAQVTASDVSLKSTLNVDKNSRWNKVVINNIHSDVFANIPTQQFDYIFINPPYLIGKTEKDADYTWFCGKELEFFKKLFKGLSSYVTINSSVLMVIPGEAPLKNILLLAKNENIELSHIKTKKNLFNTTFIFSLSAN